MSAPPTSDQTIYERPADLLQNLIRFDTTNPPGCSLTGRVNLGQTEKRIPIRCQQESVCSYSQRPPVYTNYEVK